MGKEFLWGRALVKKKHFNRAYSSVLQDARLTRGVAPSLLGAERVPRARRGERGPLLRRGERPLAAERSC